MGSQMCSRLNRDPISPATLMRRTADAGCSPDPGPIMVLRIKGIRKASYIERCKAESAIESTQFEACTIGHILQHPWWYTICQRLEVENLVEAGRPLREKIGFVLTDWRSDTCCVLKDDDAVGSRCACTSALECSDDEAGDTTGISFGVEHNDKAKLLYL